MPAKSKSAISRERREALYAFIVDYLEREATGPTIRELAHCFNISTATVLRYLNHLQGQGRITREPYVARSIRLADEPTELPEQTLAVYDFIAAWQATSGYAPSQQEIAEGCYLSVTTVRREIDRLESAERITRGAGRRQLKLLV